MDLKALRQANAEMAEETGNTDADWNVLALKLVTATEHIALTLANAVNIDLDDPEMRYREEPDDPEVRYREEPYDPEVRYREEPYALAELSHGLAMLVISADLLATRLKIDLGREIVRTFDDACRRAQLKTRLGD